MKLLTLFMKLFTPVNYALWAFFVFVRICRFLYVRYYPQSKPSVRKQRSQSRRHKANKRIRKGINGRHSQRILTQLGGLHFRLGYTEDCVKYIADYMTNVVDGGLKELQEFQYYIEDNIDQYLARMVAVESIVKDMHSALGNMQKVVTDQDTSTTAGTAHSESIANLQAELDALKVEVGGKMLAMLNSVAYKQVEMKRQLDVVSSEVKDLMVDRQACLAAMRAMNDVQDRLTKLEVNQDKGIYSRIAKTMGEAASVSSRFPAPADDSFLEADDERSSEASEERLKGHKERFVNHINVEEAYTSTYGASLI